jgi:hypothetical protein
MKEQLAYSLGSYLAEYIVDNHMPSLSYSAWTKKVIQVTWGEAEEMKRLNDAWYEKRSSEKTRIIRENPDLSTVERYEKEKEAHLLSIDEWNALLKQRYVLKEKYLPHLLECSVPYIDFSDEEINKEIKRALIESLWETDHCEYSLKEEDILFENISHTEYNITNTIVTLKLDLNPPSSYTGEDWIF